MITLALIINLPLSSAYEQKSAVGDFGFMEGKQEDAALETTWDLSF